MITENTDHEIALITNNIIGIILIFVVCIRTTLRPELEVHVPLQKPCVVPITI